MGKPSGTIDKVAGEMNISHGLVHYIIHGVLHYRKVYQMGYQNSSPLIWKNFVRMFVKLFYVMKLKEIEFSDVQSLYMNAGYITSSQGESEPEENDDIFSFWNQGSSVQLCWPENWHSQSSGTLKAQSSNTTHPDEPLSTAKRTVHLLQNHLKPSTR